jgi:hypothetical protein
MEKENKKSLIDARNKIEQDKKDRAIKAKEAYEKICKEFNVQFVPMADIGNQKIPIQSIMAVPVGFIIISN